jgi:predicted RND superfamily exporter protein
VRLYLSIAGILGVGMGLLIALGVSSVMGYPYTPMHSMLPFLCLGIGIDDMFVIVQCWNNLRVWPVILPECS